jgi:hypothetical protein
MHCLCVNVYCTVLLPPGVNPIAVKYNIYQNKPRHILLKVNNCMKNLWKQHMLHHTLKECLLPKPSRNLRVAWRGLWLWITNWERCPSSTWPTEGTVQMSKSKKNFQIATFMLKTNSGHHGHEAAVQTAWPSCLEWGHNSNFSVKLYATDTHLSASHLRNFGAIPE